jgi:hypothetical protein
MLLTYLRFSCSASTNLMQRHSSPREVGAQRKNEEKKCVSHSTPLTSIYRGFLGGETWTDPLGGDPSDCRLIGGDRDLRA